MSNKKEEAIDLLREMLGCNAVFRDGQWEAINSVLNREKTLLVQRTGWGKSIVYFIATKLLRLQGYGPTILISPLLSLMRNQIESARSIGVEAYTINSSNRSEWNRVHETVENNRCDILLISPERLANSEFQNLLLSLDGIGMFVIDEAHCISDWGHDFRPDYQRITRIINMLPPNVPVLATTATANHRVVEDIQEQLGQSLNIIRGPLTRESLKLQSIYMPNQAERMAWLAENLPQIEGSGIIYCLTTNDCNRVTKWLRRCNINVLAYHGKINTNKREEREQALLNNEVKALVATTALGMGYDKPDLGFVIHFQAPKSPIDYYQQVGRAGRALDTAYAILLYGKEDDSVNSYFINSAFPRAEEMETILNIIQSVDSGISITNILKEVNMNRSRVRKCLKMLIIDGAISKGGSKYFKTLKSWEPDAERINDIIQYRKVEQSRMREFAETDECLMKFIAKELDDPFVEECGRCINCFGDHFFPEEVDQQLVIRAVKFLQGDFHVIKPRKMWPAGGVGEERGRVAEEHLNKEGRALCIYGDAGWGGLVGTGKYRDNRFSDELVDAIANLFDSWDFEIPPTWVTAIPSLRHPDLVPDFAERLADRLNLSYRQVLEKVKDTPQQKEMENSFQQAKNIIDAFQVTGECIDGPVLLLDDMVDSRWTLTVCGVLLRKAGSGPVYPMALALSTKGGNLG